MTNKITKIPQIRFNDFTEDWEQRKLGEVLKVSKEKNKDNGFDKNDVLSVSREHGTVNQIEYQGRSFAGADVSNYKVVKENDLIYTKSPLKGAPYGIFQNATINGIISPLYAVYHSTEIAYAPYVSLYLKNDNIATHYLSPLVSKGAKNTINVTDEGALEGEIFFPNVLEQRKISGFFKSLDDTIALQERKLELLKIQKKGYLQKMFPKQNEKVPELRFKGFNDTWEQRKLGEVADIVGGGTPSTTNDDYWSGGDIDWYAPAEIGNQIFINKSKKKITELGLEKSSAKVLPIGTILFTSRAGIGNTAILSKEGSTNQGFQSIVPHKDVLDSYFIFSRTNELKRYGEVTGAGSTFIEVSGKQMAKMLMLIPKFEEQTKIGNFFKQLDDTITLQERKLESMKEMKKGFLQKLFV